MKVKNVFLIFFLGLLITGWLIFFQKQLEIFVFDTTYNQLPEILVANISQDVPKQKTPTPIIIPEFQAKSVFSFRVNQKEENVIYQKNIQEKLPIASLTKLMTAVIAIENYPLDEKITISKEAVLQEGDFGKLKVGETMSVENLLYLSLIESSNDAAYALAEAIGVDNFVDIMNWETKSLGLKNTHFTNPTGLDDPKNYSTAQDLAILTKNLLKKPLLWEILGTPEYDLYLPDGTLHHKLKNTNELLGKIPGIIGGKTGWSPQAQGCFLLVLKKGKGEYFINIILGAEDRFAEMQKLIQLTVNK